MLDKVTEKLKEMQVLNSNYLYQSKIEELGRSFNIQTLGFVNITDKTHSLIPNRDIEALRNWQDKGYYGEMSYMNKPYEKLTDIRLLKTGIKSYFFVAIYYSREVRSEPKLGYGKVARYAWGKDYHKVLTKKLELLLAELKKETKIEFSARVFSDAVPLMERAFAKSSGIGFIGKNSLLIEHGKGSFSLLAGVALDVNIELNAEKNIKKRGLLVAREDKNCGSCTKCISNCPTSAIVANYIVDANKCISYLTIEKRGLLTEQELLSIGDWIFGCDICQEVCPYNSKNLKGNLPAEFSEFSGNFGTGDSLSLKEIFSLKNDDIFRERFKGTPLIRTKRSGIIRNSIAVAINTGFVDSKEDLLNLTDDYDPIIRVTALWGISKLAVKYGAITNNQLKLILDSAIKKEDLVYQK